MNEWEENGFYLAASMHPETKWIYDIAIERKKQDEEWGGPEHDDTRIKSHWLCLIDEQANKAYDSIDNPKYGERLVKIAALAVAAMESYDRKAEIDAREKAATSPAICQNYLACTGQPYPRSCPTCGHTGPCKFGIEFRI